MVVGGYVTRLAPNRRFAVGAGTYVSFCAMCVLVGSLLLTMMIALTASGLVSIGGFAITLSALAAIATGSMLIVVKLGQWQEQTSRRLSRMEEAISGQVPTIRALLAEDRESCAWASGFVEGCGARQAEPFGGQAGAP